MIELQGTHNKAKVFTDNVEETAVSQIIDLCNQEFFSDSKIRIMPDVHAGKGCTIGTTMTITDKVVPNLVGVDIGCGMLCVSLDVLDLDLKKLDSFIRNKIPHGHSINKEMEYDFRFEIESLVCYEHLLKSSNEFSLGIGSLGGGNHFIEINEDNKGNRSIVIHSGSRNLGLRVAKYYQDRAFDYHNGIDTEFEKKRISLIKEYKKEGREGQIQNALDVLKKNHPNRESSIPKDFCYLESNLMNDYLHDINIIQKYANINRITMAQRIMEQGMEIPFKDLDIINTIHNYIDLENMVLRKGAVSAQKGEMLIIPMNMRDGSLICRGKGNEDWNFSAPHGAGRLMSRTSAKQNLNMQEFSDSMQNIYTTSVSQSTLDEAPMAYKPMREIIDNISDTVDVLEIIKPLYNFKAS